MKNSPPSPDSPSQGERPDFPRLDPVAVKYAGDALDRIATDAKEHPHRAAFNRIAHWLWQVSGAEPFDPPASQGERKQQLLDQDRAPSARPWSEVRAEHSKLSEGERATIDKAAARILEVEEQLRRSEQRNASYRASKEHLSGMYGERCAEIRQLQRDKAALVDALAREHAAYLDARTGNAGASPPPALPSSPSSASLESGGGTLDTMGAATRDTTNPEER